MKTMVIVAHPNLNKSVWNHALLSELKQQPNIHIRDLYQEYSNWNINVEREHQLLIEFDRIVFQFPFYWYSCPPLLKKWFDDVLTFGWAFGPGGDNLRGKEFMIATTTGGSENEYRAGGRNWFTISEYIRPIQSTITRCNGTFLPAFVSYSPSAGALKDEAKRYAEFVQYPQTKLAQ
ncbi:NAD(P)H-dependent oxidoreductase [Paenibacillus agaridevorans]|uniref:NAD(P)H-dependent oxidoreductase n=1 Tax=Paenibacillus agaridevorans TaxID=171404 RepID=UPI001BE4C519|nr:NAD(P)H-dependent oxidoreductase [Paenibacillus agaridevorans]